MMNILTYQQSGLKDRYTIGGKAQNLFMLQELLFTVPPFAVIPWETLRAMLPGGADDIQQIKAIDLPQSIINEIVHALPEAPYFAVRSSGVAEDSAQQSFAGQYETFLYVTREQLAEKIKAVWLSAYSHRVQEYSQSNRQVAQIAVIVQQMIDADASGVAFGINPVTGNRKQHVINAVYGLGEGLVSGELNADTYAVDETVIESQVTQKLYQFIRHAQGGTQQQEVPGHLKDQPVLSEEQIQEVSRALQRLYKHTGQYQDIEFALAGNRLYLLQTRPVTNLNTLPDQTGQYFVWDNSNIIESYPGYTSPLTFSFIVRMYERVYIQLLGLFGVSRKYINAHAHVFKNMLGLIRGRVYYNLYSWYKVLSLLPGYSINAAFMEKMMGVKEKFELKDVQQRSRFADYGRVLYMLFNLCRNLFTLKKQTRQFHRHFKEVMEVYQAIDFDRKDATELMWLYRDYETRLLSKWKAPMVNDFFAMIFFGLVHKLAAKYGINKEKEIHNDLFAGSKDIISHEPAKRIRHIVNMILDNDEYRRFFTNHDSRSIWITLSQGTFPTLKEAFDQYLKAFGDRYVGELKLETKTYKQHPGAFVKLIQSYITQENPFEPPAINSTIRQDAEKHVKQVLRWKPLKRMVFNSILNKARLLVSNRENLRYNRTLAFGIVREMMNALGRRFHAEDTIEHADDIFHLSTHEIFDFIEGKSMDPNLKKAIQVRKQTYEDYKNQELPGERFITHGMVYKANRFQGNPTTTHTQEGICGQGCCAGIVKGRVRIVHDPAETGSLNGDILVTSSTDPGWVTLFPSASGILVERGSLLSHSAIVSREMGIPCIVGITNIMQQLHTGDLIEMDGSTGTVYIIEKYEK